MNKRFFDFIGSPNKVLGVAAGVGALMLILVLIFPVTYRDSVNYMAAVNAFGLQNWRTAFNLTFVPLLFALGALFRPLGLNACQCLSLVSSALAIGMLFLGYRVLSFYVDKKLAAWGSVLYFLTPPVFAISFSPLTDSSRWFSIFLCWWLILLYLQRPGIYKLLGIGAAYAFFSLVRSEGIVFAGLFSLWFCFEQWRGYRGKPGIHWHKIIVATAIPLIFMGILLLPRLIQIHRETGFYALDTRQTWAIKGAMSHLSKPRQEVLAKDPLVTYNTNSKFHYSFLRDGKFARRYWHNFFTGNYRIFWIFSLLGAIQILRRRKWQYFHTLLCVFLVVNAVAYGLMRSCAGRYFFINTYLLMPFTLCGFICVWECCRGLRGKAGELVRIGLPYAVSAALLISILSGMRNIFSSKYDYFRQVGNFMRTASAGLPPRSGTRHPVYLIIGDNYGWGFFCNGNELVYSEQFEMNSRFRIPEILTAGVPTDFCSFAVDPLKGIGILKPDYLLVDSEAPADTLADCSELVEKIPQTLTDQVEIYRVKPGF